jgi:sporulation protein YlmC with PRC-barrel domain
MRLELGKRARCSDGAVRELVDVVVDASSHRVTHLVVQPENDPDAARLVPLALAEPNASGEEISLRCSARELEEMPLVHEHAFLRAGERAEEEDGWDVGVRDMQVVPDYAPAPPFAGDLASEVVVSYDRVPTGEIELRHASAIYSADQHHLGRVDGVVVDADGLISHLLLERGHLWWKREVSIPAAAISELSTDMVTLGVSKGELGAFQSERH